MPEDDQFVTDPLADEGLSPDAATDEDPFAEVPADLPEGVVPGTLGGVNPSEEAERLAAEVGEPVTTDAPPEAGPGDLLPEDELPVAEAPLPPEDAGLGDEIAEAEEAAEVAADFGEDGGETGVEDDQSEESDRPHKQGDQDTTTEVGASEDGPQSQIDPGDVQLAPGQRQYTILNLHSERTKKHGRLWEEVLDGPVIARSGELALRKAYRALAGTKEAGFKLVPVPTKYWKPEDVEGEVPAGSLAIKIGGRKK